MRELLLCDGCGHLAGGVKELLVLDSFAAAGPEGDPAEVDVLLVQCPCGDRTEISVPPAA